MNFNKENVDSERGTYSDFHDLLFVDDLLNDFERFNEMLERVYQQEFGFDEDILTMGEVRFNSVCILPSELESCNIDRVEENQQ